MNPLFPFTDYQLGKDELIKQCENDLGQLIAMLIDKKYKVVTAESCTCGWIAKALTDQSGSSQWYEFGVNSYSNAAKQKLLGVKKDSLERFGAVSDTVVTEMVSGITKQADIKVCGVAVSGVAGPSGGSIEKPVGTVWIAWQLPSSKIATQRFLFSGDRDMIRFKTVATAIKGLNKLLLE